MDQYPKLQSLSFAIKKGGDACPNCHRQFWFGETVSILTLKLSANVRRQVITCYGCWLALAKSLGVKNIMQSKEDVLSKLDQIKAKPFTETEAAMPEWDCKHNDFTDKPIILVDVQETETQHGRAYIGVVVYNDEVFNVLFGAQVLVKKIDRMLNELPVSLTVIYTGKYYDFA